MLPSLGMSLKHPRRPFARALCIAFALAACACGSKGAVTVTAQIQNPTLTPTAVALGTALTGSFDLILDLGPEAPKAATVTPKSFAIRNAGGEIASTLSVTYAEEPPYELAPGASKSIACTLDASKLLDASVSSALCAGDVWYSAALSDTLTSNTITTASVPFAPSCD